MDIEDKLKALRIVDASPGKKLRENPFTVNQKIVRMKMAKDKAYRISVLRKIHTFDSLSPEDLKQAALSMEEEDYFKGDEIIRQDERGTTFYIIEDGAVIVTVGLVWFSIFMSAK